MEFFHKGLYCICYLIYVILLLYLFGFVSIPAQMFSLNVSNKTYFSCCFHF